LFQAKVLPLELGNHELWLCMLGERNLGCAVLSDVFELDA